MSENNKRSAPRPRIESLSDLIFGLALSLSACSLLSKPPSNPIEVIGDIVAFVFSLLILIFVWMRYTSVMSVLPMENRTTIFLNMIMLFSVSLEPYLFNLISLFGHVSEIGVVDSASLLYALNMAGLMAILAFFTHELAIEEKKRIAPELLGTYRKARNSMFIAAGLFLLTMIPQLWSGKIQNVPVRFYLWLVPLAVSWIGRTFQEPPKLNQTPRNQ